MICKIVTLLSIMLISAYGNESNQNPPIAISSQSFHREDVPLSYKFTSIHDHKHNQNSGPLRFPSIQYAPLPEAKLKDTVFQNEGNQNEHRLVTAPVHLIKGGRHVYSTERIRNKDHLEPRLEEENLNNHNHSHRSNILGYNVELIPQPSSGNLGPFDALIAQQEEIETKQTKPPSFSYYKKSKQYSIDTPTSLLIEEEPTTTSEFTDFRGFQPEDFHNNLAMEKRQQLNQHGPRIHLNIARIYNIANAPKKEVPLPPANIGNNLVKSRGLWTEYYRPKVDLQKTILHPVISLS